MMSLHRPLLLMTLALAVEALGAQAEAVSPAEGSPSLIQVGANVHVSKARANMGHYETLLAADAKHPGRLLGGSMVFSEERNKYEVIVYQSSDGGKTWSPTLEVSGEDPWGRGDPAVAYGPEGTAYFAAIGLDPSGKRFMSVYRSKDGGKSWLPRTKLPFVDREYIVVDDTGGKFHGRVYIHGTGDFRSLDQERRFSDGTDVTIFYSQDSGVTFEPPVKLPAAEGHYVLGMGNSVVLSDGTLVILFGELRSYDWEQDRVREAKPSQPNAWLKAITSGDGGDTFSKAVIVDDFYLRGAGASIPSLAVDRSDGPFKDRLYAVWPDVRSGRREILFAYSSDKGKTWSKPVVVNDDRPPTDPAKGPDHLVPVVAVNKDGVVGVMWHDRRESPENLDWWVRFRASLDGGETFLPSVKVSEAAFVHHGEDERWVIWAEGYGGDNPSPYVRGGSFKVDFGVDGLGFYYNGGHTAGMAAAADGVFHPFWVDNRTGISQVWTAPVTVKAKAVRNGSIELAELEDVSEKATIEYMDTHYDRATNTLSVDAQVVNTSEGVLTGPVKLRVLSLQSRLGVPEILNADNGEKGAGAVWDFSPLLQNDRLEPQQKSEVKRLHFRLSDLRPLSRSTPLTGLIHLEAKLLGKLEKKALSSRTEMKQFPHLLVHVPS